MSKYGLYTKNSNESSGHINTIDMPSISQAEAYFAGVKQMPLEQFQQLFIVKEMKDSGRQILYGNK
jgi:hypothetical protein